MKKMMIILSVLISLTLGVSAFASANDGCQALMGTWTASQLGILDQVKVSVARTGGMIGSDGSISFEYGGGHNSYGLSASCSGNVLKLTLPHAVDLTMTGVDATHVHVNGSVLISAGGSTRIDGDLAKAN